MLGTIQVIISAVCRLSSSVLSDPYPLYEVSCFSTKSMESDMQ